MPKDFMSCVDSVMGLGKSKSSAYAICTMQYKKRHHGKAPKLHHASIEDITPTEDEISSLAFMYEEIVAAKQYMMTQKEMKKKMKGNY